MADYPGPWGLVHGRLYAPVGDTVDAGRAPDRVPLNGTAVFSANVERIITTTPGSESIDVPQKITAQVTGGALQWLGTDDVPLVANLDAAGNSLGWQWRVDFALTYTDPTTNTTARVTLTGWAFDVKVYNPNAALVNGVNPTITQLTQQAPVVGPNVAQIAKGDPGPVTKLVKGTSTTTTDPAAVDFSLTPTADPLAVAVNMVLPANGGGGGGGAGTVTKVNGVSPDGTGALTLTPANLGAATTGDVSTAQATASNALTVAQTASSAATTALSTANNAQSGLTSKADASALNAYAPLASPTLTGNPKAPTPATATNDTSIATMAAVRAAIAAYAPAGGSGTSNQVYWNATTQTWTQNGATITARPSVTGPVVLWSTNDANATRPSWWLTGDAWVQHPDAVGG